VFAVSRRLLAGIFASRQETTMESEQSEPLAPQLVEAEETLKKMLEEACSAEVYGADTGQLIRIEEVLAIAGEAAKEAISIRRKRRSGGSGRSRASTAAQQERALAEASALTPPDAHRIFEDSRGVRWDACAIHPSAPVGRVQLPEPYRSGWLFFDSTNQKRRLSPIPAEWQSASDETLRALCEAAEIVPERAPSRRRVRPD
jgi:hypothetical protein